MNANKSLIIMVLLVMLTFGLSAEGNSESGRSYGSQGQGQGQTLDTDGVADVLDTVEIQPLSDTEKEGILLMREEEKLARDVYITLYEKWDLRVFSNISKAEQTHMNDMLLLMERYNLADPVGVFTSEKFGKLYTDLVAKGSTSLESAVGVGSTIEELDIYDLERLINTVDNNDVKIVYQNLLKGLRNHLRAFDRQPSRDGESYEAYYLTQQEYDKIANSSQEQGTVITDPDFKY